MESPNFQPFRFLDLPGELRNHCYQAMLCSFDPPTSLPPKNGLMTEAYVSQGLAPASQGIEPARHTIDTTILRTCKKIHREAYDVMVKTNQFIRIQTMDIPIPLLLLPSKLPIVTMDRAHADQFQGYIIVVKIEAIPGGWVDEPLDSDADSDWEAEMDTYMHAPPAGTGPRFNFMILGRDWDHFCGMLAQADAFMEGFSYSVQVSVTLNAYPAKLPAWKAPVDSYFTPKTQEDLLAPFCMHIHGFEHVSIDGSVDRTLAKRTIDQVRKPQWTDPKVVIADLEKSKAAGNSLWAPSNPAPAVEQWRACIMEIRRIYSTASFSLLIDKGGEEFCTKFTEIYFTTVLNLGQGAMRQMQTPGMAKMDVVTKGLAITRELTDAALIPTRLADYGSRFAPDQSQVAKLGYRRAVCWRLLGQASDSREINEEAIDSALVSIDHAAAFQPNDASIKREREAIMRWESELVDRWAREVEFEVYMPELPWEAH
ncbi:hypothetical protein CC80DRAFT_596097 [Byssothecium circinans]|uniref:Uncharacterized protein n=1 Tax=Byssothecium circinans TaxID=147558 RepID=A0A6A5TLF6_9PLEO|nr:hypothetical protein CC80DRAFT_596097 [Byssothecium circinans]